MDISCVLVSIKTPDGSRINARQMKTQKLTEPFVILDETAHSTAEVSESIDTTHCVAMAVIAAA